jgi:hypothetical protein
VHKIHFGANNARVPVAVKCCPRMRTGVSSHWCQTIIFNIISFDNTGGVRASSNAGWRSHSNQYVDCQTCEVHFVTLSSAFLLFFSLFLVIVEVHFVKCQVTCSHALCFGLSLFRVNRDITPALEDVEFGQERGVDTRDTAACFVINYRVTAVSTLTDATTLEGVSSQIRRCSLHSARLYA